MGKLVAYNQQMLEKAIEDIKYLFEQYGRLNISYEKASKERTQRQVGFVFAALINGITEYLQECGFNVDSEDVRYKLYEDVSVILPEMVVDKQIFGGKPRIKHISEMDRDLMSKFIDGIFHIVDTSPMYAGICLHPSIYLNFLWHLDIEEIKNAEKQEVPQFEKKYLEYIRTRPCLICGIQHRSEAHHIRDMELCGISQKSADIFAIPLCHNCHMKVAHGIGFKESLKWLPYDIKTVCKILYLRWKNGIRIL